MSAAVSEPRAFPIGAVITLAVGSYDRPYCPLGDLYDVLGHMLATVPNDDQLQSAIDYCRPAVLTQHPELADVPVPPPTAADATMLSWLAGLERRFGTTLTLVSMQAGAR